MTSSDETIQDREGEGFDTGAVERYVREHVDGLPQGELEVEQFPSGASNLTYLLRIRDADGKVGWEGGRLSTPQRGHWLYRAREEQWEEWAARDLPLAAVRDVERDEEDENAFVSERGQTSMRGDGS